jgi:hypothetical protein
VIRDCYKRFGKEATVKPARRPEGDGLQAAPCAGLSFATKI